MIIDLICAAAAFVGAAVNAAAGGGTFLTFPTLTGAAGLTEKAANITSTVGLWPGYAASVAAARPELRSVDRSTVTRFALLGLVGGAVGAGLLLTTPAAAFRVAIPWLLLFATVIFALGKRVNQWARRLSGAARATPADAGSAPEHVPVRLTPAMLALLIPVTIYNGYFGAGGGVLLLAALSAAGLGDVHRMNAVKLVLQVTANAAAVVVFLGGGVDWRLAAAMAAAAVAGGFAGIVGMRRLPQAWLRALIVIIAAGLTAAYFVKTYGPTSAPASPTPVARQVAAAQ